MADVIYILSEHDEHGAENLGATMERSRLVDLVDHLWSDPPGVHPNKLERHHDWVARAKKGLTALLEGKSDGTLMARRHGWNCHDGWGGMQLHVSRIYPE